MRLFIAISIMLVGCSMHDQDDTNDERSDVLVLGPTTHRAVANGAWDEPSTWGGNVPSNGAGVVIPVGITVSVRRQEAARLSFITVRGTLRFVADVSTRLFVETIQVAEAGRLHIGSADAPVVRGRTAEIVFIDTGAVRATRVDPMAMRRGLIAMGEVKVFGSPKTAYATVSGALAAGTNALTLDTTPTGWRADDAVVVPSTQFRKDDSQQNELGNIASIAGNVVTLEQPLSYRHRLDPSMAIHIANLTRNVVFRSENTDLDSPRRGHVMLMSCDSSVISNAAFVDLGRTDKRAILDDPQLDGEGHPIAGTGLNPRGRYPLHFHLCGVDQPAALVTGSVVTGSPGWGMVNHGSRVSFSENVVYDFIGAGFVAEDGTELGDFTNNFAAKGIGIGRFDLRRVYLNDRPRLGEADFAFHGDCFWFQIPLVTVRGSIAAGCKGVGFFFHAQGLNKFGGVGFRPSQLPELVKPLGTIRRWASGSGYVGLLIVDLPVARFTGNVAYGNFIGLKLRYVQNQNPLGFKMWGNQARGDDTFLTSRIDDPGSVEYSPYLIESSKFWNNFVGIHNSYTTLGKFKSIFIGADDYVPSDEVNEQWVGWEASHGSARCLTIEGLTVKSVPVGIMVNPDPVCPHTIAGYQYTGQGSAFEYVTAGGGIRE